MNLLKKLLICTGIFVLVLGLSACKSKSNDNQETVVLAGNYNQELAQLFPDAEGYKWEYYGTSDYGHHMKIDKIYEANSQKVIKVTGEVADLAGSQSEQDFSLEVTYAIESDRVVQTKLSDRMMDSEYDHITLIMSPLLVGTKWHEETVDSQGKRAMINGEIIESEENGEGTIYKVLYTEEKSDYSEVRKIQKGKGVIDFVKTLKYEDQSMEISYHLYRLILPEEKASVVVGESEKDRIKGVVFKFDELWIDFVNQGSIDLMDYVVEDSPVSEMIKNYIRDDTRQKYLSIQIADVNVNGTNADVKVYEKMQQTGKEEVQIFEYRWIYHLQKKGEQWYIHSYEADPQK